MYGCILQNGTPRMKVSTKTNVLLCYINECVYMYGCILQNVHQNESIQKQMYYCDLII